MSDPHPRACYKCHKDDITRLDSSKWIFCSVCRAGAHAKCVSLSGIKASDLAEISWACINCIAELKVLKNINIENLIAEGFSKVNKEMDTKFEALKLELAGVSGGVSCVVDAITADATTAAQPSADSDMPWSKVVSKGKKRKEKKNILILKSTNDEIKATDKKEEVARALTDIQINDSRFTAKGNMVLNFENETMMKNAAEKIEKVDNMTTKTVKKLKPKVMICNVHEEESESEIIKTIISRNEYLQTIDNVENKIDLVFTKQAAGKTTHYILKCEPAVREMFHRNNDRVKLKWGVYALRDRYHALACFYCQRHGHTEAECNDRTLKGEPHCSKCAGKHKSNECPGGENKCINCMRREKTDVNHRATDHCCPILTSVLCRIRDLTDHGF